MLVFRYVNSVLSSNTYILSKEDEDGVYVIDPGDSLPILEWLHSQKKTLIGFFLTHAHYDHIFGLNDLLHEFQNASLYVFSSMIDRLFSVKLNTSLYHEKPYTLHKCFSNNFVNIEEGMNQLLWEDENLFVLYTPGHTKDSISLYIDNYLFSGDALIPGKKVFSRRNMSDSDAIRSSLDKIYCRFSDETILLPGHGKEFLLGESKSVKKYCSLEQGNEFIELLKTKTPFNI
jgi:hydroxyacylglutathione hydrolase